MRNSSKHDLYVSLPANTQCCPPRPMPWITYMWETQRNSMLCFPNFYQCIRRRVVKKPHKTQKWSDVRKVLVRGDPAEFIDLIKELYDASPANRDFLHARFAANPDDDSALRPYLKRITTQFYPSRGYGKLNLAEARRAIRDYRKATGNVAGTAELMLTYVENGTAFTCEYGDINSAFYSSLESVLGELVTLLCTDGRELYPRFRDRIQQLATHAGSIGWGYGDFLREQVFNLKDELGES
jgi:hypothetical protein